MSARNCESVYYGDKDNETFQRQTRGSSWILNLKFTGGGRKSVIMIYICVAFAVIICGWIFFRCWLFKRDENVVAFFHPYCNAGGGGERVLWGAIKAMQDRRTTLLDDDTKDELSVIVKNYRVVVFTGDCDVSKEEILLKAKQRFGVEIYPNSVNFIYLRSRRLVEADLYPIFTLLLQTLGGGILALEALLRMNPGIFIDTMGYPMSFPIFKYLGGCRAISTYVHYPTISCDMIDLVERRESSYNNNATIAKSGVLSSAKLFYYKRFASFYGWLGSKADIVMVNGSWTASHIRKLWPTGKPEIIYPPCDVTNFLDLYSNSTAESSFEKDQILRIVSIGQIRPEKNHRLQLEVLQGVKEALAKRGDGIKVELVIAGGCRNADDEARVTSLKGIAKELNVEKELTWQLNCSFDTLMELLCNSLISIHTMWNEHFGISVVEGAAAGTIMLAHNSGGPKMDILIKTERDETTGFLASSKEEYVERILHIISLTKAERNSIRRAATGSMERFSEEQFDEKFIPVLERLNVKNKSSF